MAEILCGEVCGESCRGAPCHDDTIPVLCRDLHDPVRCPIVALPPSAALVARGIGAGDEVLEDGVLAVKRNEDGLRVPDVAEVGRIDAAQIDDRRMPSRDPAGAEDARRIAAPVSASSPLVAGTGRHQKIAPGAGASRPSLAVSG